MNEKLKEILIHELETELGVVKKINVQQIADQIYNIGFQCIMCGKCCRRDFGDNRVAITTTEIHNIENESDLKWEEIAEPFITEAESPEEECKINSADGLIDEDGNIHTFGWMLKRKKNGDCSFIPDDATNNRCGIYKLRPLLCSTYPFYIEGFKLNTSECEGIGKEISHQESCELAELVLKRYILELEDTILTYKNYIGFKTGDNSLNIAESDLKQGYLNYIIHYSEGSCRIRKKI
ncbi:YkgJ family cysteine cluster protein [Methanolobus bombayensis]|uniref:YkgJ family cysteine cluster protein n=1 Tax=Methanolobus bombayensis TaxID=38023 RepID=UPI001AE924EE|nr:YkgJ family cysteine cluster protein [Methanolobus bombayensis]MBP1909657.1 Fe-S-cluster containining protein [Methanolobus bombayensis]